MFKNIVRKNFIHKRCSKTSLEKSVVNLKKGRKLKIERTLFACRSSESPSADAITVDAFAVTVAIRYFTLVVLELALQTFPT